MVFRCFSVPSGGWALVDLSAPTMVSVVLLLSPCHSLVFSRVAKRSVVLLCWCWMMVLYGFMVSFSWLLNTNLGPTLWALDLPKQKNNLQEAKPILSKRL